MVQIHTHITSGLSWYRDTASGDNRQEDSMGWRDDPITDKQEKMIAEMEETAERCFYTTVYGQNKRRSVRLHRQLSLFLLCHGV